MCRSLWIITLPVLCNSQADSLPAIVPESRCPSSGEYFDATAQRCLTCQDIDKNAFPASELLGKGRRDGRPETSIVGDQCLCAFGSVQCPGGETCLARHPDDPSREQSFVPSTLFECRQCPTENGNSMAPTRDRRRCVPCHVGGAGDNYSTLGYSGIVGDCVCPDGYALIEQDEDGSILPAKRCVRCSGGAFPGSSGANVSVYGCSPCPDMLRMRRNLKTGLCECNSTGDEGTSYINAGGMCIAASEFNVVNNRFPEASATIVSFHDFLHKDTQDEWKAGPFGHHLGIEASRGELLDLLRFSSAATEVATVTSSAMKWLYMRCAVGCLRRNATACQCVSNLCVLTLYDGGATVCRFLTRYLYEGRPAPPWRSRSQALEGLPWLYYRPQPPVQTLADDSLDWSFTFSDSSEPGSASSLRFWLAKYSLEGSWLGWEKLESQLELCTSETPGNHRGT